MKGIDTTILAMLLHHDVLFYTTARYANGSIFVSVLKMYIFFYFYFQAAAFVQLVCLSIWLGMSVYATFVWPVITGINMRDSSEFASLLSKLAPSWVSRWPGKKITLDCTVCRCTPIFLFVSRAVMTSGHDVVNASSCVKTPSLLFGHWWHSAVPVLI